MLEFIVTQAAVAYLVTVDLSNETQMRDIMEMNNLQKMLEVMKRPTRVHMSRWPQLRPLMCRNGVCYLKGGSI